jgi:hypothetical protein
MRFSYIVMFEFEQRPSSGISSSDLHAIRSLVPGIPGIIRADLFCPEHIEDIYTDDGGLRGFGFQLYFEELETLEAAIGPHGALQAIADPAALPSLAGSRVTQQAMLRRSVLSQDRVAAASGLCSFLVYYPGPALDMNEWLGHYLEHHPPVMKQIPNVREIEILTRIDWIDSMPWQRVHHMQRNRGVFENMAVLGAALQSPVRHIMQEDYEKFPPFEGGSLHYGVSTEIVLPDPRRQD